MATANPNMISFKSVCPKCKSEIKNPFVGCGFIECLVRKVKV